MLEVKLSGFELKNLIIFVLGCFGFGKEFVCFYDLFCFGVIMIKVMIKEFCFGNLMFRVVEIGVGMFNVIGF